jgi:hypothetical protein
MMRTTGTLTRSSCASTRSSPRWVGGARHTLPAVAALLVRTRGGGVRVQHLGCRCVLTVFDTVIALRV